MGKYFYIQLKRLRHVFLPLLLAAAVLFGCFVIVYDAMSDIYDDAGDMAKFKIGIVGTADEMYMQMAISAVSSIDSTRFSIDFLEMEQSDAEKAMQRGSIDAYVVFPEGFLDAAFHGKIIPLKFVCTAGSVGLVSMIKNEFTQMIEIMVTEAQRGIYGSREALASLGLKHSQVVNNISLEYAELVFRRGNIYRVSTQPSFDGLGMGGYLITGICIVLFLLICLTFSPIMVRRDYALCRILCARGCSVTRQVLCDFAVYLLGLLTVAGVILVYLVLFLQVSITGSMLIKALPALLALGAMSFLMYELASNLISGVLLQFFVSVAMCFVSGCMYPITFFPETMQKISLFLPTGVAREQIAHCMRGTHDWKHTAALLGYCLVFTVCSILIRRTRITGARR